MNRVYQQRGKPNPSGIPSGIISHMPWLARVTLTFLVGAVYLPLAAAQTIPEASAGDPSAHVVRPTRPPGLSTRKNSWRV